MRVEGGKVGGARALCALPAPPLSHFNVPSLLLPSSFYPLFFLPLRVVLPAGVCGCVCCALCNARAGAHVAGVKEIKKT